MTKDIYVNVAIKYEKVANGPDIPSDTLSCWVANIDGKVFMKEKSYRTSHHDPKKIILSLTKSIMNHYSDDTIYFYSDYGSIYDHLRKIENKDDRFQLVRRKNLSDKQLGMDNYCQRRAAQGIENLKRKRLDEKNALKESNPSSNIAIYTPTNNLSAHAFYVATDASYSEKKYKKLSFVSWVSEDGDVFIDKVKTSDNNEAEAYAVKKALKDYTSPERNLVILTDSRYVTDAVKGYTLPRSEQKELRSLIDTLQSYRNKGHSITIEKVRGHSGHVMNESAHRAANFARNHHNDYGSLYYQKEINLISKTLRSLTKIP